MNKFLISFVVLLALLTIGVRLMPHLPNFTPVGALALFAGAYLGRRWSIVVPLLVMLASDFFIGFYDARIMAAVYGSFALYGFLGMLIAKSKNPATVLMAGLGGATLFYLVTNFAVWLFSPLYPATFQGLMLSYTLALPFFRAMLLGDIIFTAAFFGVYELAVYLLRQRQLKLGLAKLSAP